MTGWLRGEPPYRDRITSPRLLSSHGRALTWLRIPGPDTINRLSEPQPPSSKTHVPERPTLDGLEEKWSAAWERDGTYSFDRSAPRERVFSIDTPPPTVSGSLHVGPRVLLHPHGHGRALPADARARRSSTRWAGTTTAYRPSGGCRTTTACAATRRSPYDPGLRAAGRAVGEGAGVDLAAELRGAVPAADRDRRAGVRGAVAHAGAVGGLVDDVHDDRPRSPSASPSARSWDCSSAVRPTSWRRRRCGTWTSRRRSRRPSSRTASARGRCTGCASHPDGDGRREALIETTRPELIPACVALLAHPDDERHRGLVGTHAVTPLFGTQRAGADAPAGGAGTRARAW